MGTASRIKVRQLSAQEARRWKLSKKLAAWFMFSLVYLLGALSALLVGAIVYLLTS